LHVQGSKDGLVQRRIRFHAEHIFSAFDGVEIPDETKALEVIFDPLVRRAGSQPDLQSQPPGLLQVLDDARKGLLFRRQHSLAGLAQPLEFRPVHRPTEPGSQIGQGVKLVVARAQTQCPIIQREFVTVRPVDLLPGLESWHLRVHHQPVKVEDKCANHRLPPNLSWR